MVERNDLPLTTPETTTYYYDSPSRLDASLTNGITTDYVYDALNRLKEMTNFIDGDNDHVFDAGESIIGHYVYGFDAGGNRIQATETDDQGLSRVFYWNYDADGRLISEVFDGPNDTAINNDYIVTYQYDLAGNRLHKYTQQEPTPAQISAFLADFTQFAATETITYAYDVNNRLITELKDAAVPNDDSFTLYTYDATSMIGKAIHEGLAETGTVKETDTYAYDVRGRMTSSSSTTDAVTTTSSYVYNSSGMRCGMTTSSTSGGTPTSSTYLVDPANPTGYAQILEEHSGGTLTKSYTLGQDVISQWDSSHGLLTLTYDAHGSVRAAIGSAGAIQRYAYDAFGNLLSGTGLSTVLSATWTSLLYSGEQTDSSTHLQYLRARYYDPSIGRFGAQDNLIFSAGDTGNANLYLYCGGNPVMYGDPSGMIKVSPSILRMIKGLGLAVAVNILIGIRATYVLGEAYKKEVNPLFVDINRRIARLDDLNLSPEMFDKDGNLKSAFKQMPDIVDHKLMRVYEVKSYYMSWMGLSEVNNYMSALNQRYPGRLYFPGTWQPMQSQYTITNLPGISGLPPITIHAENIGNGVITWKSNTDNAILVATLAAEWAITGVKLVKSIDGARLQDQLGITTLISMMAGF